jgi:hypothetical protein
VGVVVPVDERPAVLAGVLDRVEPGGELPRAPLLGRSTELIAVSRCTKAMSFDPLGPVQTDGVSTYSVSAFHARSLAPRRRPSV